MAVLKSRFSRQEETEDVQISNGVTNITFSEENSLGVISLSGTIDDMVTEDIEPSDELSNESGIKVPSPLQ